MQMEEVKKYLRKGQVKRIDGNVKIVLKQKLESRVEDVKFV
jgi:hypothetical protein